MSRHRTCHRRDSPGDSGMALAVVMGALVLSLAFTSALVLTLAAEARIATIAKNDHLLASAAQAVAVRALVDLRGAEWDAILAGGLSTFIDGPPSGWRPLPDGTGVDLGVETSSILCGLPSGCSEAEVAAVTDERPWGTNNPRWRLYAYGSLAALLQGDPQPLTPYVVAWVADDPTDADDDPSRDGDAATNPGRGVLMVLARAYGPRAARRSVQLVVERVGPDLRLLAHVSMAP